jgi:hypothetical protein
MNLEIVKRIDAGECEQILTEQGIKVKARKIDELIDLKHSWLKENGFEYLGNTTKIVKIGTTEEV